MPGFDFLNPNNTLGLNNRQQRRLSNPRPPRPPANGGGRGSSSGIAPTGHPAQVTDDPYTGRRKYFSTPVGKGYRISTNFGPRIHPITGRHSNHTGMDLAIGMGSPVYAPRGGTIEQTNRGDSIYGNQIVMRNSPSLESMYGHLQDIAVEQGQKVKRGDLIGYVGSTGLSTGPHLHWEAWRNGQPFDPAKLWDKDLPHKLPPPPKPKAPSQPKFRTDLPDMDETDPDSDLSKLLGLEGAPPVSTAPPGMPQGASGGQDPRMQAFLRSIATQESNGNYGAVGVDTGGGHRAYGKYQIMDFNINGPGGWDQEALGKNIDINEFLNSPELQEQIARWKLSQYYKQYGPLGAAKAWYAGPGNANTNSNAPQYGGPSINGYAQEVFNRMQGFL